MTLTVPEVDLTGEHTKHSQRWGSKPWLFVLHTQEGNGTARSLHNYFKVAAVSYHYTVDDKELIGSVDTDRASWSVLDANPYTINLCFAGSRAGMSREEWLSKFSNAINLAARVAVRDCLKYGISTRVLRQNYQSIARRLAGMCDHSGITYGLGIGDHTDVGKNFPWDVFEKHVVHWENVARGNVKAPAPVAKPVAKAIDVEAEVAKDWIGKRIDADEKPCKDNEGRYSEFENARIYWHPRVNDGQARAIPNAVFETYSEHQWEQGYLGYPVGRHTVLSADGEDAGVVQGFEGGAIYRKNGEPGYVVTGLIREQWNRSGFENGPYGWPVSNERPHGNGGKAQDFENGTLYWEPDQVAGHLHEVGVDTEQYK